MATSGSASVAVTSWDTLKFDWSQTSQSIPNNCTYIKWTLTLVSGKYGAIYSAPSKEWNVTVNGTKHSGNVSASIGNNTSKTLASGTDTIYHNTDGTKSFSFSFSHNFSITFSNTWIGTKSGSGSAALNTIPRASTVSATNATIGNATSIKIDRKSSAFTHTLRYSFCALSETIVTKTSSVSYSWTVPDKWYNQIPNDKKSWATIYCDTYNGNTLIGTKSCTFDVTVNDSVCTPVLNPTVVDTGSVSTVLTGNSNVIILNYNNVKVTFNASAKKSATINSMKVTCGNASRTSDGRMGYVSNGTFVFSVTDSRGYSVSKTITKTTIPYIPLTCSLKANPNLSEDNSVDVALTISGNYFSGSFGATNNSLTVLYRYKTVNGEYPKDSDGNDIWTTIPASIITFNGTYTVSTTVNSLDYTEAYVWQAKAVDKCNAEGILTAEQTTKIQPVFDWSESDFNFNVPVSIQGSPLLDYVIEQGTSGNWTYRKWASGIAECWGMHPTSFNCKNNVGNCWFTDWLEVYYPTGLFLEPTKAIPVASCADNWSWLCMVRSNSNNSVVFRGVRSSNYTTVYDTAVAVHAIGRWKR